MIHDRRMDRAAADTHLTPIEVGLTAAIVAVEAEEPRILVAADAKSDTRAGLPFGPFDPLSHRTFEIGLRDWKKFDAAIQEGYDTARACIEKNGIPLTHDVGGEADVSPLALGA